MSPAPPPSLPRVLFEDEVLLAFDKPSGLLIAPDRWDKKRVNLMGLVHAAYGKAVANVHRIDADTSGLVLCTKTKEALDFVSGQFQSKTVRKTYLALAVPLPPERAMKVIAPIRDERGALPASFSVDLALGPDETKLGHMRAFRKRGGKASLTEFVTLERFRGFALLHCHPQTGRTHQIRVHLAAAGAPVLNDPFYGDPEIELKLSSLKRGYKGRSDEKPLLRRLALHASALTLTHPQTREPLTIEAPLPDDFEVALKYLRKFAAL